MTRAEKLTSMRMTELVSVAEGLGIKINVKASKSVAVEKILKAEAQDLNPVESKDEVVSDSIKNLVSMPGAEKLADLKKAVDLDKKVSGSKARITITFKGETKSPAEWGKEFNMNPKYIRLQLRKGKTPEEIFGDR